MDDSNEWEPVAQAVLEEIDDAIDRRLQAFRESLDEWLGSLLAGPIPADWRDDLAAFVDRTAAQGLAISSDSIDKIAAIVESRARDVGEPSPQDPARRLRSRIVDGAFVQSVIPNVSEPGDGFGGLADLVLPDRYSDARGRNAEPVRTYDERRDIVNGKPVLFFSALREPNGDWFTGCRQETKFFQNGRSLSLSRTTPEPKRSPRRWPSD